MTTTLTTESANQAALPPIPLVSGDHLLDGDGAQHSLADVRLVMTTADGRRLEVPLVHKYNGWWPAETNSEALTLAATAQD